MKLVVRSMGSFLVAALAVALVISAISYTFIPKLSEYIDATFPEEKNLELISSIAADPDPEHEAPADGEVYETDFYTYTYVGSLGGWKLNVINQDKENYSSICGAIYGKPVVSLNAAFKNCNKLIQAPAIPAGVKDMTGAFEGCSLLKGTIVVYATPTEYSDCFKGTVKDISLTGSGGALAELATTSGDNITVK